MFLGKMFTPRDLTLIAYACTRVLRHEPDMRKRKEWIALITKLQQSYKSRRTRAERRVMRAARAGQQPTSSVVPLPHAADRPGEERS